MEKYNAYFTLIGICSDKYVIVMLMPKRQYYSGCKLKTSSGKSRFSERLLKRHLLCRFTDWRISYRNGTFSSIPYCYRMFYTVAFHQETFSASFVTSIRKRKRIVFVSVCSVFDLEYIKPSTTSWSGRQFSICNRSI